MKKTLHIKVDENGNTLAYSIKEHDIDNCDFHTNNYPNDYIGKERKYIITEENGEVVFTAKDKWEEYESYLSNFDYGEMYENNPMDYEEWVKFETR